MNDGTSDTRSGGGGAEYDSNKASGLKATIAREDRKPETKEKAKAELEAMGGDEVHYGDEKDPATKNAEHELGYEKHT